MLFSSACTNRPVGGGSPSASRSPLVEPVRFDGKSTIGCRHRGDVILQIYINVTPKVGHQTNSGLLSLLRERRSTPPAITPRRRRACQRVTNYSTRTNDISPASATSRSCTGPGRASPTSPSRSRSSRSWPGCFTSFGLGWNNGGPAAIAWGWPIVSVFILIIGLCMSELVSAFPTSGGIYWWAAKLGGPKAGYYTGWLNLIGLIAILASVAYGCATFLDLTLGTFSESWLAGYSLHADVHAVRDHPGDRRRSSTSSPATCWRSSTTSRCGGTWPARPR